MPREKMTERIVIRMSKDLVDYVDSLREDPKKPGTYLVGRTEAIRRVIITYKFLENSPDGVLIKALAQDDPNEFIKNWLDKFKKSKADSDTTRRGKPRPGSKSSNP